MSKSSFTHPTAPFTTTETVSLIMLLMQSDMLKAIWFMIYPAMELVHGRVASESTFCQASGFFLTLGIEACDIAVLLIAMHTALAIYGRSNGNGLYPHRKYAFASFAGIPLLLASLAFQNDPAFANSGEYCYLPMRPRWTRMALSWIPRYVIFGVIVFMYVWIYFHVRFITKQFTAFSSTRNSGLSSPGRSACEPKHTASVPPLPLIQRHGLVPSPEPSPKASVEDLRRRDSLASVIGAFSRRTSGASTQLVNATRRPMIRWKLPSFRHGDRKVEKFQASLDETHRRASSASSRMVPSVTRPGQGIKWKTATIGFDANNSVNNNNSDLTLNGVARTETRRHTVPSILPLHAADVELQELQSSKPIPCCLPHGLSPPGKENSPPDVDVADFQDQASPSTQNEHVVTKPNSEVSPKMSAVDEQPHIVLALAASRRSSLAQTFWNRPIVGFSRRTSRSPSLASMFMALRGGARGSKTSSSVFLSPTGLEETGMKANREALRRQTRQLLIYPLVYLAVWICPFVSHLLGGRNVPFPLMIASLFSLCIQGAADALIFALREKPWGQIKTDREDEGGRQLRDWWRGAHDSQAPNMGRTPDERLADARNARKRLNAELEQRRSERNESERQLMPSTTVDWWQSPRGDDWT